VTKDRSFEELARDLERLEDITRAWDPAQQHTMQAIRETVEALSAEAFRRLIRRVKDAPGGIEALKGAVEDDWVRNLLSYHGILRKPAPSPEERVLAALARVRPTLAGHSGDVELIAVVSEREVHIRLTGSCDGCAFSDATVRMGIETEIKKELPTLEILKVVDGKPRDAAAGTDLITLGKKPTHSPFERPWHDAGPDDLREGVVRAVELPGTSVLLARVRGTMKAYPNACAHLGMPLDMGEIKDDVITCPYHGFRYMLETGECLTAPEIQLPVFPVKVERGRVLVQVVA
jgi:nitrite reductase/ring-hydroxylating ferredoxin subunit/Fe-S cluster biogenesis protein NfuA